MSTLSKKAWSTRWTSRMLRVRRHVKPMVALPSPFTASNGLRSVFTWTNVVQQHPFPFKYSRVGYAEMHPSDSKVQAVSTPTTPAIPLEKGNTNSATTKAAGTSSSAHTKSQKEEPATCTVTRQTALCGVEWIDVYGAPKVTQRSFRERVKVELRKYDIHASIIKDIVNPTLLPSCCISHQGGSVVLLSLRFVNVDMTSKGHSIGELSQSISMLISKTRIVTVRRFDIVSLRAMQRQWDERFREACHAHLVNAIFQRIVLTYEQAVQECYLMFDRHEISLLKMPRQERANFSKQIYELKRRVSVYARLLNHTQSAYMAYTRHHDIPQHDPWSQEVQKIVRQIASTAEEVDQNAASLLQLNFQLSANDLNNMMMVLTIFSVLFVPIDFVAAFFGMNFSTLPMTNDPLGPGVALVIMIIMSTASVLFFRKRGFL